jgi:uncharacterized membrane protein YesL
VVDAWRVLASAVNDIRDIGVYLVLLNILWFFACILIITAPPATAALYAMTREMGYRNRREWKDFFRYLHQYFWISWRWGLINFVAVAIYAANLIFYESFERPIDFLGRGVWTVIFLLWILVQMYCFPVLMEQEQPRVRTAIRNGWVLVLRHPLFTLVFAMVLVTFTIASIAVAYFWVFFTVSLLCYFYNRGVWYLTHLERGEEPELGLA